MSELRMHAEELPITAGLVHRLLAAQFPQWADLPLAPVPSAGTDNAIFRLGDDKAVRLPRIHWATGQVAKEREWLPKLAPAPQGRRLARRTQAGRPGWGAPPRAVCATGARRCGGAARADHFPTRRPRSRPPRAAAARWAKPPAGWCG
jgi:aminoglycoside phosphotransferase (APT) family kinase protein